MRTSIASLLLLCMLATSTKLQAASFAIIPEITRAFDSTGAAQPIPADFLRLPLGKHFLEIQLSLRVASLGAAEQGFGNIAFDVETAGDLKKASTPFPATYAAVSSTVDHDGMSFTDPIGLFADNGDLGVAGDLRSIVVGLDPLSLVANDARLQVGRSDLQPVGKLFVEFDGINAGAMGTLRVVPTGASVVAGGRLALAPDAELSGSTLRFASIPEPSSFAIMSIALLPCVLKSRRRRSPASTHMAGRSAKPRIL